MPHSNEDVIKMVRSKLEIKNQAIAERDAAIRKLEDKVRDLENRLAEAHRQLESREGLIDAIGDILNEDA
ncbi:hypothetical protein HS125_12460 [bacterium]|nr:hypothetical protein [bacterium]